MRSEGSRPFTPAARHAREVVGPPPGVPAAGPASGRPGQAPPTLSLVLSRKARRRAAEAAAAAAVTDPRLDVIERVLTGLRLAGDVAALALSVVSWVWISGHGASGAVPPPDVLTGDAGTPARAAASPLLHPLAGISGTSLVLVMLLACLMMAPSVNPFYAAPPEGRLLQISRTAAFAVLAVSTVAVVTGAAR